MDLPFLILTIIILVMGVIMVLSASYARAYNDPDKTPVFYFLKHAGFAVSGLVLMFMASRLNTRFYRGISIYVLLAAIFLLVLVPFIGIEENGARRWINILGLTTFQPSEAAKLAVIMGFAAMICSFKEKMQTFKYGVLPFAGVLVVIVGLLLLEPHLSASIIIIAIGAIMMFVGGTKIRWFVAVGITVALAGAIIVGKMGYAMDRIQSWRDPFSDLTGNGWQIVQSLYAVGSGGFMGLGLGQGRQKFLYLPEEHNDFIFAVICEELGFVGAVLILILFALLVIRGFWIALHAKNRYSSLLATGISSLLAIQVFLNVAVVTNFIPCTGISLPFFSYGGTALWIQLVEMGMVLSVSREIPVKNSREKLKKSTKELNNVGKEVE
ncbi:MAG: putative lipid II flippase FtsW [Ruminococcaceae bacterium]|nr:putative lipid II flippase FtsW [Oscillospiraceae bacterium]